jgi:ligand-binding SRPBCC domain-containing protein
MSFIFDFTFRNWIHFHDYLKKQNAFMMIRSVQYTDIPENQQFEDYD